jgi:hypothetical protein
MRSSILNTIGFADERQIFEGFVKNKSCLNLTKRKMSSFVLEIKNYFDRRKSKD